MNPGDRVFLVDSHGRHEGTITKLSHREGLVIVKWDTGMTERVPVEELGQVEAE